MSAHQPGMGQVHVDGPLTNVAIAHMQSPDVMMAARVFPIVAVNKVSDKYFIYDRADFLRNDVQERAPGAPAARSGYKVSTDSYLCRRHALAKDIPDPVRANSDSPLNQDRDAVQFLTSQLALDAEIQWASKFFTTSVWTGSSSGSDITPSTLWSDAASTPVEDVKTQKRAVLKNTTKEPNKLVLGITCFDKLCDHPDILDRIKHAAGPGNPAIANEKTLAMVFGVEEVLVCKAVKQTAGEGQTASYSFVQDAESALLVYAPPTAGIQIASGGYTFVWQGVGNPFGIQIKSYRRPEEFETDSVEGNFWYDHKVISAPLGVFFSNAVSA
jgi:hypothetical protein